MRGQAEFCIPKMNFAVACLAALAVLASASASVQPTLKADVEPIFTGERITNGRDAVPNSRFWQVSLQARPFIFGSFQHICGGSIVNEWWIVSAAHCYPEVPTSNTFRIVAGGHNLNRNEATQQVRSISRIIRHPGYRGGVGPHDIILFRLGSPLTFNNAVSPIALPASQVVHSGNAVLSGWGSISMTSAAVRPTVLQEVTVPILTNQVCWDAMSAIVRNPPLNPSTLDNVCTGPIDGSRISACSGDSGGPLAQEVRPGVWELVGVVSWGIHPCGTVGAPSVFVRTSNYIDWINEQMRS